MEQPKYNRMLYAVRRDYYKVQFNQQKGDSKHLYKLVAKLTGGVSANPMPYAESDLQLVKEFAYFFHDKRIKVRKDLHSKPNFKPADSEVLFGLEFFQNCQKGM